MLGIAPLVLLIAGRIGVTLIAITLCIIGFHYRGLYYSDLNDTFSPAALTNSIWDGIAVMAICHRENIPPLQGTENKLGSKVNLGNEAKK